jgi:hypothetical protein
MGIGFGVVSGLSNGRVGCHAVVDACVSKEEGEGVRPLPSAFVYITLVSAVVAVQFPFLFTSIVSSLDQLIESFPSKSSNSTSTGV